MAVVTVKSAVITDLDASPRVAAQSAIGGKYRVNEIDAIAAVAATDNSTSKYLMFRVPSTIRVKDLWLEAAALGGSCAADIGLYYASRAEDCGAGVVPGAVIDADWFASAVSLVTALTPVNVNNESLTNLTSKRSQPLWQMVGLSADPGGKFDIVMTLTADAASGGNVYLKMGFAE